MRKYTRSRIPALPEAAKNLLALHSLDAWPYKYNVFVDEPAAWRWRIVKASDCHTTGRVLWLARNDATLNDWMDQVKLFTEGKLHSDFGFDPFRDYYSCSPCGTDKERMRKHFEHADQLKRFPWA